MSIFGSSSSDDEKPQFYVLDPTDYQSVQKAIGEMKVALSRVGLDYGSMDFTQLARALDQLQVQLNKMDGQLTTEGEVGATAGTALITLGPRSWMVPFEAIRYPTLAAFVAENEKAVSAKNDAPLLASYRELASFSKQKDSKKQAAVDYFARFLPHAEEIQEQKPGALRRIFDAICSMLKRFFESFKRVSSKVWDVLSDPDAYYIRLRGEVMELARLRPEYVLLNWVLVLPDLFRLYVRLLFDDRVSFSVKSQLFLAVGYLVSPIDFVPEGVIGPAGYVEDAFLLAKAILDLTNENCVSRGLLEQHWAGEPAALDAIMYTSTVFSEHLDIFRIVGDWFTTNRQTAPT